VYLRIDYRYAHLPNRSTSQATHAQVKQTRTKPVYQLTTPRGLIAAAGLNEPSKLAKVFSLRESNTKTKECAKRRAKMISKMGIEPMISRV
jgi:hypothetical protein